MVQDNIKELRKTLLLTQEQFAKDLGITKTTISTYENGRRKIPDSILISICNKYNVNMDYLKTGKEPMFIEVTRAAIANLLCKNETSDEIGDIIYRFIKLTPKEQKSFIIILKKLMEE